MKMRPDVSLAARRGGSRMPSGVGGGGAEDVGDSPAVAHRHRRDVLLHAVLVDLEVFLLQVGNESSAGVLDDDVHVDGIDPDGERWELRLLRREALRSTTRRLPTRNR